MSKLTIAQAAEQFNVSKEAIHNRVRRGTLNCIIENGIKYIVTDTEQKTKEQVSVKSNFQNDKYYLYIEEENKKLKEKIELLENENRCLRDEKISMLENERDTIESIYKERDEQLKNVLSVMNNRLPTPQENNQENIEEIEVLEVDDAPLISLKKYIKTYNFSEKKSEKIVKRFKKAAKKDARIKVEGEKIYLQPSLHDYSDLL